MARSRADAIRISWLLFAIQHRRLFPSTMPLASLESAPATTRPSTGDGGAGQSKFDTPICKAATIISTSRASDDDGDEGDASSFDDDGGGRAYSNNDGANPTCSGLRRRRRRTSSTTDDDDDDDEVDARLSLFLGTVGRTMAAAATTTTTTG
jgi:hypothetical protein